MWASGDTSLACARITSFVLGLASAALVLVAARVLVADRRGALAGALVAALFPWSARLGVATIPELPTAALAFFSVATLTSARGRLRILGGAALALACLSRYEPWLLAIAFVGITLRQLRSRSGPSLPHAALGVAFAVLGPLGWIAHNAHAHGEAFHFLALVSAYKRAVGGDASLAVLGYPLALLREEPELWLGSCACAFARRNRGERFSRVPIVALAFMVATLSLAAVGGGAPTHHNGRALLVVWLAVAVYLGAALERELSRQWRTGVALLLVVLASLPLGAFLFRPWYARLDAMADREDEARIGAATRTLAVSGPILLEVNDFGFFAVEAGSGRPEAFVLDRSIDPRGPVSPSCFTEPRRLRERIDATGARAIVARESAGTSELGVPVAAFGSWRLWRLK
jgi:hypothetical protein